MFTFYELSDPNSYRTSKIKVISSDKETKAHKIFKFKYDALTCSRTTFLDDVRCLNTKNRFNFICAVVVNIVDISLRWARRIASHQCDMKCNLFRVSWAIKLAASTFKWTISSIISHSSNEYYNPLVNLWTFIRWLLDLRLPTHK